MSKNQILAKMLDRLFAGLTSGPNLNCKPHSSRQRVDWMQFAKLQDLSPGDALRQLLSDHQATELQARVAAPKITGKPSSKKRPATGSDIEESEKGSNDEQLAEASPEDRHQKDNWSAQQALLTKLRGLAEDAREYEQDTGVHVLHVGFPLLSLPPGVGASVGGGTKRLLAPIAFIPVSLEMRAGLSPIIAIEGLHDGADFLVPNEALFAWLERQTGKPVLPEQTVSLERLATESSTDAISQDGDPSNGMANSIPSGSQSILNPWEELNDLTRRVAQALKLPQPMITAESVGKLCAAPKTDVDNSKPEIVLAAVIGLFPMNNQGLLRDMQAMSATPDSLQGPVQSFISAESILDEPSGILDPIHRADPHTCPATYRRNVETERLISVADPCQSRAVRLARNSQGLVIHGPPGTGKSQTITNIIGDHLARGERVLLVCDKRTALDVVARRLEHLGLGSFCALIHDPQHDQRNLYMQIREQLEQLVDTRTADKAALQLQRVDQQLQKSHDTLLNAWSLVMTPDSRRRASFHERMGEWLASASPGMTKPRPQDDTDNRETARARSSRRSRTKPITDVSTTEVTMIETLDAHLAELRDVVARAVQIDYMHHPWRECVGTSLSSFLEQPMSRLRQQFSEVVAIAADLDQTPGNSDTAFVVPEHLDQSDHDTASSPNSFPQQLAARQNLATNLKRSLQEVDQTWRARWAKASQSEIKRAIQQLQTTQPARTAIETQSLDPALKIVFSDRKRSATEIASQRGTLQAYMKSGKTWYGWIHFGIRRRAHEILSSYGLSREAASAEKLLTFLTGVTARTVVEQTLNELTSFNRHNIDGNLPSVDDGLLLQRCQELDLLLQTLQQCEHAALARLRTSVQAALSEGSLKVVETLNSSAARGELLEELRLALIDSRLLASECLQTMIQQACGGESIMDPFQRLVDTLDSLGEVLRLQSILAELPRSLKAIVEQAITSPVDAQSALEEIRYQVLTLDIDQWLKSNPQLQGLDGAQLSNQFREVHRLEGEKQPYVQDLIRDFWIRRQRERLLASTGSRLNSVGADLRRRLTTRGERAMRLRQVISIGRKIEGGDPLFDLRPVWMASPETVAQIFPREALFDVVIFDEASQCRLEEALPVLTRAKRVVIAGDPKQLPPTRFFESSVVTSDHNEVETEQDLFEAHQSEVEDLLTAALSLDIQESHLDVHYRSRNADLVQFSNQQFYGSRLQPIPGHPRNRIRFAPISLYHVAGVYEERANTAEAAQVVKIVADLLRRSEPPSIGIACFNLTQRDAILEALAELAAEDHDFADRLIAARNRIGAGAFEGLFVKNLENVQGDERDHMIISTTYGPDKQGRFYRRFGPLGQAGGGRRLNVLVTRARDEVHLVTSIPKELYRSLPAIPEGQHPGGGWLLFAYLSYAERLTEAYQDWRSDDGSLTNSKSPHVFERPSNTPSAFASQLAQVMAKRHGISSDTHWGNDGFCVDVAFHHPQRSEDRTLGLLCDATRFLNADDDPVTWDVFRTAILEGQGWQLLRCWTPQFFRDPEGQLREFAKEAMRIADSDPDPEGIPVEPHS